MADVEALAERVHNSTAAPDGETEPSAEVTATPDEDEVDLGEEDSDEDEDEDEDEEQGDEEEEVDDEDAEGEDDADGDEEDEEELEEMVFTTSYVAAYDPNDDYVPTEEDLAEFRREHPHFEEELDDMLEGGYAYDDDPNIFDGMSDSEAEHVCE